MRILIVEDTANARIMLERSIKKWGYEVDSVSNSADAIALLQKEHIPFVITDWVMPGGDGPSLCRNIRALNLPHYTYIILVTALDSNETAIEGLDAGADDFLRKPIHLNELQARIRSGERVLSLEKTLKDRNNELTDISNSLLIAQDHINHDLQVAAKMQQKLLPMSATNIMNVNINWLFCPSEVVSGDFFNFFRLDENRIAFYALDVCGHGVSSAMYGLFLTRMMIPGFEFGIPLKRKINEPPFYEIIKSNEVINALNEKFQTTEDNWLYFTMGYGLIDKLAKTIEFCNGGHPLPIYLPYHQPGCFVSDGGFPVGLYDTAEYESLLINYQQGDRFVMYSDGITECFNEDGEMFGSDRLLAFIEETRNLSLSDISKLLNDTIRNWRGKDVYDDDISLLILEIVD